MNNARDFWEEIFELLNMLAEINFSLFHVWAWPLWVDGNILSVAYAERDRVFGVFEMWTHLLQVNLEFHVGEVSSLPSYLLLVIR